MEVDSDEEQARKPKAKKIEEESDDSGDDAVVSEVCIFLIHTSRLTV